jgi:hypothetical protein
MGGSLGTRTIRRKSYNVPVANSINANATNKTKGTNEANGANKPNKYCKRP